MRVRARSPRFVDTPPGASYIPAMPLLRPTAVAFALLSLLLATGCESNRALAPQQASGPASLRIHPTFTQVKDVNGTGRPDGVEAVVEVLDQFGEPIRGWGTVTFELNAFRRADTKYSAERVAGPWKGELLTKEQQDLRWSPALRSYTFPLGFPAIATGQTYVLQAWFETAGGAGREGGGRLFDKLILEPEASKAHNARGVKKASGNRR